MALFFPARGFGLLLGGQPFGEHFEEHAPRRELSRLLEFAADAAHFIGHGVCPASQLDAQHIVVAPHRHWLAQLFDARNKKNFKIPIFNSLKQIIGAYASSVSNFKQTTLYLCMYIVNLF